jgi:hypothetical protein
MDGRIQQLISMLRGGGQQPQPQPMQQPMPQMGGMAGQAQQNLQTLIPAYKQHQIQAMESGQQPMPFEQFVQQMQGVR